MIYHLINAGVPISWSIVALYPNANGIAHNAAQSWQDVNKSSHVLVEVRNGEVRRCDLMWVDEDYKQYSKDRSIHVQGCHSGEAEISEETRELIAQTIHAALVEKGFLIENAEWEQRYPASKMVDERFAQFFALQKEKGENLVYEDRWAMMMAPPEEYEVPYNVKSSEDGYTIIQNRIDAGAAPEKTWKEITDAENICRMMNSGWSYEEALILITPEPVENAK